MKKNKDEIIIITILCLLTIGFFTLTIITLGWPYPYMYNNFKLKKFLDEIKKIELPTQSKIINSRKNLGIYWGASNHCDAIVMALVESNLDPKIFASDILKVANIKYPELGYKAAKDLQIFLYQNNKFFYINKENLKEVGFSKYNEGDICINCLNLFTELEKKEVVEMKELVNTIKKRDSQKNYYILRATDQLNYARDDFRCN